MAKNMTASTASSAAIGPNVRNGPMWTLFSRIKTKRRKANNKLCRQKVMIKSDMVE